MSNQNHPNDHQRDPASEPDIWAEPTAGEPSQSPFGQPETLEASRDGGDFFADPATLSSPDEELAAPKPKPNYAIVAAAGLIGLAVLGGAGWFFTQQILPSAGPKERDLLAQSPQGSAPQPASVFDAPTSPKSGAGPTGLLEQPPAVPAQVVASAASSPAGPAVAQSAPLSAPPLATAAPTAAAAPVAAAGVPAAPAGPVTVAQTGQQPPPAAPPVVCPDVKPAKARPQPATRPAVQARAKPKAPAAAPAVASAAPPAAAGTGVTASAPAAPAPQPVVQLPEGMRVQAVYPLSGPDVQAWVRDAGGRTTIVRVGEFLSGARVTAISAERGEVHTAAGVLTTGQGAR